VKVFATDSTILHRDSLPPGYDAISSPAAAETYSWINLQRNICRPGPRRRSGTGSRGSDFHSADSENWGRSPRESVAAEHFGASAGAENPSSWPETETCPGCAPLVPRIPPAMS